MKTLSINRAKGLTLVELAVVIVVLGILTVVSISAVKRQISKTSADNTHIALNKLDAALVGYLRLHRKLPYADTNGDGIGDINESIGKVPFQDLGMDSVPVDGNNLPLTYIANTRLLTSVSNQFLLCQRLKIMATSPNLTRLHSDSLQSLNFAVLSAGNIDSKSNNSLFDLVTRTADGANQIDTDGIFDDRYKLSTSFSLLGELNCAATIVAVNAMENELVAANLTKKTLDLMVENTNTAISNSQTKKLLATFSIVAAAGGAVGAAATMLDAYGQGIGWGNAPAVVAATGAVVGFAAAVAATVTSSIIISDENTNIAEAEEDLVNLAKHIARTQTICNKIRTEIVNIKGSAQACN